jgi:hypothetical protein
VNFPGEIQLAGYGTRSRRRPPMRRRSANKLDPPMSSNNYSNMTLDFPREWLEEFEAAARRPLRQRFRYSFIKTYKPVMDDAKFRAFDTTADYRRWCEENLPSWLGYGRI